MPYKDKEKFKEYHKEWRSNNKETISFYVVKYKYGVTQEIYDEMLIDQNFSCAICEIHVSNLKRRLVIDHCHKTNKVRGLLCSKCNIGLGHFNDNIKSLSKAIGYLYNKENTI